MIVYIVEDTLHCVYKGKLFSMVMKNAISKGFIINKDLFIQEFIKMSKNAKIKSKLFGDSITVVNNGYFRFSDLFLIEAIFSELGFIKVDYLDIRELFPTTDALYIEVNINYMVLYLDNTLYIDLAYFKDIPKTLEFFKAYFYKNIALFGVNKCIPRIGLETNNVYYIENYVDYITQSLLKVKRQGVELPFFIDILFVLYYNYYVKYNKK